MSLGAVIKYRGDQCSAEGNELGSVTIFKLGCEIKSQEKLEVVGWQVIEECTAIVELCNIFHICIQFYLRSWDIKIFWFLRLGLQVIFAGITGGNFLKLLFHLPPLLSL